MSSFSYNKVKAKEAAGLLKILSSGPRLQIIGLLLERKKGLCVNEIAEVVGHSQSATSHQLAKLADKGVIQCARDGKNMCYQICQCDKARSLAWVLRVLGRN